MPKRDKLFQLVRSLSKSEKRYFSIYTQMHIKGEDNDYMKLFKEFDRQEVLDEQKIKAHLDGERLLEHYAVTKSYLYDLLLKAMRSYSKHSPDKKVLDLIQDVEFLYGKGIFDQALQLVNKARELSVEFGLVAARDLILHWEKLILLASGYRHLSDMQLSAILADQEDISQKRKQQQKLWLYSTRLSMLRNGDYLSPETPLKDIQTYVEQNPPQEYTSFYFRNYYLDRIVRCQWFLVTNQTAKAQEQLNLLLSVLEGEHQFWKRQPYLYLRALSLEVQTHVYEARFSEARKRLQFLKNQLGVEELSAYAHAWLSFAQNYIDVKESVQQGMKESAKHKFLKLQQDLRKQPGFIPEQELNLEFMQGLVSFLNEEADQADGQFIRICRQTDDSYGLATQEGAWLMRIAVQLQNQNDRKLSTICLKYLAFLDKQKQLSDALKSQAETWPTPGSLWTENQKLALIQWLTKERNTVEPKNGAHRCRILALEQLNRLKESL